MFRNEKRPTRVAFFMGLFSTESKEAAKSLDRFEARALPFESRLAFFLGAGVGGLPEAHLVVGAGSEKKASVSTRSQGEDPASVGGELFHEIAGVEVPKGQPTLPSASDSYRKPREKPETRDRAIRRLEIKKRMGLGVADDK